VGALIYIGQTGDPFLGGAALFALSMGMGTPLLMIGTSAGKLLPRAGGWMNAVKAGFGVSLLAVAIWMVGRILPGGVTMMLWAILAIVSAVYLGALRKLEPNATGWAQLWQGSGVVLLAYGIIIMIGAAAGSTDPLQPLRALSMTSVSNSASNTSGTRNTLVFKRIRGLAGLETELAAAVKANKTVMLDFYADWCVSCKEMEHYTFTDPGVQTALANTVLLQADVTANDELDKALLKRFGIFGPPSILFFDLRGSERTQHRVVGFMKPSKFKEQILRALAETK
jgi:thiol:disulfide interchange protein DsbD